MTCAPVGAWRVAIPRLFVIAEKIESALGGFCNVTVTPPLCAPEDPTPLHYWIIWTIRIIVGPVVVFIFRASHIGKQNT